MVNFCKYFNQKNFLTLCLHKFDWIHVKDLAHTRITETFLQVFAKMTQNIRT